MSLSKLDIKLGKMKVSNSIKHQIKSQIYFLLYHFIIIRSKVGQLFSSDRTYVTIFGSCRQDAIYQNFKVSKIRNGLTYPHYSKEVIQAIRYCSDKNFSVPAVAFRNNQIKIPMLSRKKLASEFKKTNVFVIEIASMLEYLYENFYVHHEIVDNPSRNSSPKKINLESVQVKEQSIPELITDLETIVQLLNGKKVIFVTHISTRESGKRADLIRAIVDFCAGERIPVFNPSEMLQFYTIDELFESEKVLSHYTARGHQIVGYRYRELIEICSKVDETKSNFLTQKIEQPRETRDEFTSGFGDFLNGALKVYAIARQLKKVPMVDLSDSLFKDHIKSRDWVTSPVDIQYVFHQHPDYFFSKSNVVFTNKVIKSELTAEMKDFVYRNCLQQSEIQKKALIAQKKELEIENGPYVVVHIRLDDNFDSQPDFEVIRHIESTIAQIELNNAFPLILLSNSNYLRENVQSSKMKIPRSLVRHSADQKADYFSIENTIVEFFLLANASQIFQISTYPWGSGFSALAARLFGVSIKRLTLDKE